MALKSLSAWGSCVIVSNESRVAGVLPWWVEIKQLLVLTAATTALIDVVEQSHDDTAIL